LILTKNILATFWAIFSQTHLVTLVSGQGQPSPIRAQLERLVADESEEGAQARL
jgi:hypothetical protein